MNCAYVVRRRKGLYVRKLVPPALRKIIGKEHILKSLKTRDMAEANRRKWAVLAEIEALFEKARRGTIVKGRRDLNAEALALREVWERADPKSSSAVLDDETTERDIVEEIAANRAEELEDRYGLPTAQRFYKLATARMLPLSMALEAWLKEREESKAVKRSIGALGSRRSAERLSQRSWRRYDEQALAERARVPITAGALNYLW